jgi:uncharacterized membrane protein
MKQKIKKPLLIKIIILFMIVSILPVNIDDIEAYACEFFTFLYYKSVSIFFLGGRPLLRLGF